MPYQMPDKAFWESGEAKLFGADADAAYARRFVELSRLLPGDSVLDMGCGPGIISALVACGHDVVAADFSEKLLREADGMFRARGLGRARALLLDWNEDWEARGIGPGSFDVCLASRSLSAERLPEALSKLHATSRRRVCLTVCADPSPRVDARMMRELGLECGRQPDSERVAAALAGWGVAYERHVIPSQKHTLFADRADALDRCLHMLGIALGSAEAARCHAGRLQEWLDAELVCAPDAPGALQLKRPRTTTWAFFAWDKV